MSSVITPARVWSKYQRAIFDWVDEVNESGAREAAAINAVAGSGKTTVLLESLKRMTGKMAFFAFNVAIANELKNRAPRHAYVRTIHSLGFATLRRAHPSITVPDPVNSKIVSIVEAIMGTEKDEWEARSGAMALARLVKLTLTDANDVEELKYLLDYYDVNIGDEDNEDWIIEVIPDIMDACLQNTIYCDFDDQLWMPIAMGLNPEKYDWVGVDECQDLSNVQRALVLKARTGRMISCGDPRQAIMGFAAANCDSFDLIVKDSEAKVLPLSICYRCPTSHVALAQELVPQIEAAPNAIQGVIREIDRSILHNYIHSGDMMVCRTNAPLATVCMELVQSGIKATIKGRDIGKNLVSLIRRMHVRNGSITSLITKLEEYRHKELVKFVALKRFQKAISLDDRIETLYALSDGLTGISELEANIADIFRDDRVGVMLSTVHRAKGLEADNVFLLRPDLLPHPMARTGWSMKQEQNLKYVALTRAKQELTFVADPSARQRDSDRREQLALKYGG